jgi:ElaB/YqjD/DUF883 family membrane-anchored ribosome-binding protein
MMTNRVKDGTSETPAAFNSKASAVRAKAEKARETVTHVYSSAREKASSAYGTAREKTSATLETVRTRASHGRERTVTALDENPVAALVGGLALGALVGALLPRGRREAELLSGVGGRINETTKRVADAARVSARDTIDNYGLNADTALDKVNSLFEDATKAATTIGKAARDAMHKQR